MSSFTTALCGAAAAILISVTTADASTVTASTTAWQTRAGQTFELTLDNLVASDGTGGFLTIYARGDFEENTASIDEYLKVKAGNRFDSGKLGGFNILKFGEGLSVDYDYFGRFEAARDVEFRHSFALGGSYLDDMIADGSLFVEVAFSEGVDVMTADSRVRIDLTYTAARDLRAAASTRLTTVIGQSSLSAVPLPASLPLLAIGVAGAGLLRRRRRRLSK